MQDKINQMDALLRTKERKIKKLTEDPVTPMGEFKKVGQEQASFEDVSHIKRVSPEPNSTSQQQINLIMGPSDTSHTYS